MLPPYGLEPVEFAFPALAACAARAAPGGERELAMGAYVAARLASAAALGSAVGPEQRMVRAERARHWLAMLALPQQARLAFFRAFDGSVGGGAAAEAIGELARTLVGHLDDAAHAELAGCAERLRLYYENTP